MKIIGSLTGFEITEIDGYLILILILIRKSSDLKIFRSITRGSLKIQIITEHWFKVKKFKLATIKIESVQ
jgi:hypothetical protein